VILLLPWGIHWHDPIYLLIETASSQKPNHIRMYFNLPMQYDTVHCLVYLLFFHRPGDFDGHNLVLLMHSITTLSSLRSRGCGSRPLFLLGCSIVSVGDASLFWFFIHYYTYSSFPFAWNECCLPCDMPHIPFQNLHAPF